MHYIARQYGPEQLAEMSLEDAGELLFETSVKQALLHASPWVQQGRSHYSRFCRNQCRTNLCALGISPKPNLW
jgi:hypothetical protein